MFVAAMGGVFALTECAAENIRGENDAYNAGIAGCAAGLVAGVRGMDNSANPAYDNWTCSNRHVPSLQLTQSLPCAQHALVLEEQCLHTNTLVATWRER